jgi:hypothetical protein
VAPRYEAGEVIFFANTGSLLAPITAEAYHEETALVQFDLFSHLGQLRQGSSVHAQHTGAKGILGRMRDELSSQTAPYRCKTYSMSGNALAVSSKVRVTPRPETMAAFYTVPLLPSRELTN